MNVVVKTMRNIYARFERPISSLSLIGGFVFDAVTLRRVDQFWENMWVIAHLVIVAVFMVLVNASHHKPGDEEDPEKAQFWYVNILQFFFGGLLSTYLVFYFRSADLTVSWLFLLILAVAFWANESLKRQYAILSFQMSLFFLSLYLFAIFIFPIIFQSISYKIFLFAGGISFLVILVFTHYMMYWNREKFQRSKKYIFISMVGILLTMNILYFTNIIPPLPLSLVDAGVFHSIHKNTQGNYDVAFENYGWKKYITLYEDFHLRVGDPAYVFSAVFSPTSLNIHIIHEWKYYDEGLKNWTDAQVVDLPLIGGREGGYRTYSMRTNLEPGQWRVTILTPSGQVLGRVRFNVVSTTTPTNLSKNIL